MIFLETDHLLLRSHTLEDEEDFVAMQMDPEVRRFVGGKPWPRDKAVSRFHERHVDRPTTSFGLWATLLKSENHYIGHCGLHTPCKNPHSANLGFYLARPYWGKGFATEACIALIDAAFLQMGLDQVVADVEWGNVVSEHLLQKFGFLFTEREEIPGRVLHHYKLVSQDWSTSTPSDARSRRRSSC